MVGGLLSVSSKGLNDVSSIQMNGKPIKKPNPSSTACLAIWLDRGRRNAGRGTLAATAISIGIHHAATRGSELEQGEDEDDREQHHADRGCITEVERLEALLVQVDRHHLGAW